MFSRTRTRWGLALAVLVALVVGFTSAAWMPSFAEEPATATEKPSTEKPSIEKPSTEKPSIEDLSPGRFLHWSNEAFRYRTAEEMARKEGFSDKSKLMGMEVRYDSHTATTIYMMTESGAIATAPNPPIYVLRTAKGDGGVHVFRLGRINGQVFVLGDSDVWEQLAPHGAVGNYELVLTPVGDKGHVTAFRINQQTGETWFVNAEGGPKLIPDPKIPEPKPAP